MSLEIIKHTAQQDCERVSSQSFNTLLADVRQIIENGRKQAYNAVEQVDIILFIIFIVSSIIGGILVLYGIILDAFKSDYMWELSQFLF